MLNDYFVFSGGEVHTKVNKNQSPRIVCKDYTMQGFMHICQLNQVLKKRGWQCIELIYPYFPYARQDRWIEEDEPFSLKIFADLLNSQEFYKVIVYDPHSDVTPALINNCKVVPQWEIAFEVIPVSYFDTPLFISPDVGAYKKVSKLVGDDSKIAIGVKNRNGKGEIISTNVYSKTPIKDRDCIIVDDICDGGRTFIELGKKLKEMGATSVSLYVTHGIFSRGIGELFKYIDKIYTTDSFPAKYSPSFIEVKELNYNA